MSEAIWSPDDIDWAAPPLRRSSRVVHGGASRPQGKLVRFVGTGSHGDRRQAALRADHPAVVEGRTLFPSTVVRADQAPRVLVSGVNSAKIGKRIVKGPWKGLEVFTLTLEERATCPKSCGLWSECFGNAMHLARRVKPGEELERMLGHEIVRHLRAFPAGIAIRLHVLGDFYDASYVAFWLSMLAVHPRLHVFGFTAVPAGTSVGRLIALANARFPDRCAIRFSVQPDTAVQPGQATTIWRLPTSSVESEGLICPAQTHKTESCGSCGLCWSPAAWGKRIVFVGHGLRTRRKVAA